MKSLARNGDTAGLIDAVFYRDRGPGDVGAEVRAEAVSALAQAGPDEAGLAVVDALTDSSDLVRSAAVRVLYRWNWAWLLADALRWLPADRGTARNLALVAIAELAQAGTARRLGYALTHSVDDEPLRENEVRLLLDLLQSDPEPDAIEHVVDDLVTALCNEREAVARRAEHLLAELAPASTPGVHSALRGPAAVPRAAAVLARIGDLSALEPLIAALEHPNPEVRSHSCIALGELRAPVAVEPLLRAAHDPEPDVRGSAGAALDRIGTAAVIVGISALVRPATTKPRTSPRSRKAAEPRPSARRSTSPDGNKTLER